MNSADQKQHLRNIQREQRRSLSASDRNINARATLEVFKSWVSKDMFPMSMYLAFDGELDPEPLIEYCWSENLAVYLPIVNPGQRVLAFAPYDADTHLTENQYGILQPQVENSVRADTLRTLLMPLTAFDATGARLGMGGGYYDRTLATCEHKPNLIGLAYAFQQVDKCPIESHDEPLSGVLTTDEYIDFS